MSLLALLTLTIVGVLAWYLAEYTERRRNVEALQQLESKVRVAESRTLGLREQYEKLKETYNQLTASYERERSSQGNAIVAIQQTAKREKVRVGIAAILCGLMVGGFAGGVGSWSLAHTKFRETILKMDVVARVAEMNAGMLRSQLEKLEERYEEMEHLLNEERIAKTIAFTKLEILLENLVTDKWKRGYSLDAHKLMNVGIEGQAQSMAQKKSVGLAAL